LQDDATGKWDISNTYVLVLLAQLVTVT